MKQWLKRLLCMHPTWTRLQWTVLGPLKSATKIGFTDWRTGENYWGCVECGKVRNFGWDRTGPRVPVNFVGPT